MNPSEISIALAIHYSETFERNGANSLGVDWGPNADDHRLRLDQMLHVMRNGRPRSETPSLLDVGCGFGSLIDRANELRIPLTYTGIDICKPMVEFARNRHPQSEWIADDFLNLEMPKQFDYVICNRILTQKLEATIREMDDFLKMLVRRMFDLCKIGCAFNTMTSHVNFTSPNLCYRSPSELVAWCMSEISSRVVIDSAYPLFEFTVYIYREDADTLAFNDLREVQEK